MESDDEIHKTDDCDVDDIVMAIDVNNRGDVGCCYYIAMEEKLLLLSEVSCGGLEIVDTCIYSPITYSAPRY